MPEHVTGTHEFGPLLRHWRQFRRLSQLDLSLTADISQRHLSWLETGRSRPSRTMVVQLAEALDVPLRERNQLLDAAGFAALYRERGLDESGMASVRDALRRMLDKQMPYPGIVLDRDWNVVMTNASAEGLVAALAQLLPDAPIGGDAPRNLALLTVHPNGLRRLISNWDAASRSFVQRLRHDLARTADPDLRARLQELIAMAGDSHSGADPETPLLPILPLDMAVGGQTLRLYTVISTFGTPQDVTTDELRIESFFPIDDASDAMLRLFAGGG